MVFLLDDFFMDNNNISKPLKVKPTVDPRPRINPKPILNIKPTPIFKPFKMEYNCVMKMGLTKLKNQTFLIPQLLYLNVSTEYW